MLYADNDKELERLRKAHPSELICLRTKYPRPWILFLPRGRPIPMPNGGFPKARRRRPTS